MHLNAVFFCPLNCDRVSGIGFLFILITNLFIGKFVFTSLLFAENVGKTYEFMK